MKTNKIKESTILKKYTIAQIFLWIAFAAVMIGVGVLGSFILRDGPQIFTIIAIIALFVLCFVLGAAHGHVNWQMDNMEEKRDSIS